MTRAEVLEMLLESVKTAAVATGITSPDKAARWGVEQGSKTYGRAYRLYQLGADELDTTRPHLTDVPYVDAYPYGSGHYSAGGLNDYLGMTHGEAESSLRRILDTLWAVQRGAK